MSTLYLSCGLCGRKQASGLLSRAAWGHLDTEGQGTLCACPACKETNSDWESQLLANGNRGTTAQPDLYRFS